MSWVSHPNLSEIIRAPGYVFWNPTALDEEANWGTKLGYTVDGVSVAPNLTIHPITYEVTGKMPRHLIYVGPAPQITVHFRNYNAVALARFFPGLVTGTKVSLPGNLKPGNDLLVNYTGKFLYVPDNHDNPALLITTCAPCIIATAKLILSHQREMTFPCIFWVKSGFQLGKLEDLSL